jgi:hypothetical protein
MGGGGGHGHGPHVPEFHDKLGKFCLVSAFFWIMYRAKENKVRDNAFFYALSDLQSQLTTPSFSLHPSFLLPPLPLPPSFPQGQIFGWYQPWLHEHDHEHLHYALGGEQGLGDSMPTLEEHEDDEEEHEEEE